MLKQTYVVDLFLLFWGLTILLLIVYLLVFNQQTGNMNFPFFCNPDSIWSLFSFILTALIGVKWNLKMVLMVIHQTNKDVEYFKRYFLVILISLRNNLLRSIANVFIGSFVLKILFFLLLHIFMLSSVQPRTIFPSEKKEKVSQIKLGLYMQL